MGLKVLTSDVIASFQRHTVPLPIITDPPPNRSCCGQHSILHGVSRLSHLYLLSSVKRTHRQSGCSLTNANHSAESWGVRTGPTHGCRTVIPPSWSTFRHFEQKRTHNGLLEVILQGSGSELYTPVS